MVKISPKNIAEAVYEATEGKSGANLAAALKRSVQILRNKKMLGRSNEVLGVLQDILDKKTGTVRMKVSTAKKMSHVERSKLEHDIKKKYNAKNIVSEFFEKEDLLGGVKIEVGEEVLDNTYKNKLNELKKFLIQEK